MSILRKIRQRRHPVRVTIADVDRNKAAISRALNGPEWDAFIAQARDQEAHMPHYELVLVHPEDCRCGEH